MVGPVVKFSAPNHEVPVQSTPVGTEMLPEQKAETTGKMYSQLTAFKFSLSPAVKGHTQID